MIKLTDLQRTIIEEGSNSKFDDIRELPSLKKHNPAVREKIIKTMLEKQLIAYEDAESKTNLYFTEKSRAAINKPWAEENPPAEISAQKPISKKQIMLILLKEGTTIEKLMQMTGWQKHTVHGSLANLKKQLNLQIESSKNEIGERVYKVAS